MMGAGRSITIIQGHPDPENRHFGHALAEAYAEGAREAGHEVNVISVSQLDFRLLRNGREYLTSPPPEAIRDAQSVIEQSDHLLLVYPVWNGTMPAVLKGFLEQTFRPDFVFPDRELGLGQRRKGMGLLSYLRARKALSGKSARIVATMGMPAFLYRWHFRPHPERTTLRFSGVRRIRSCWIGRVDTAGPRARKRWLRKMRMLGRRAC